MAPRRPADAPPPLRCPPAGGGGARRSLFSYSVAAAFVAKDQPFDPAAHVFHFQPDHPDPRQHAVEGARRPESGQDAFFISRVGDAGAGAVALGVADGVGGWMESGVDPADFSHGLCAYMAAAAAAAAAEQPRLAPRALMDVGYQAVRADRAIAAGGSTAVVALLGADGGLEVANLGDSGFLQLRLNGVHAYSEPQTHAFNTPFQLSVIPPNLLARMAAFGGAQLSDEPRDAEVSRHRLRHGDVLVFASDGVWDNLFNQDLLQLVSRTMTATGAWLTSARDAGVAVAAPAALRQLTDPPRPSPASPASSPPPFVTLQSLLATRITAAAKAASVNAKVDGPFAKEVKRYYPQETWHGGKVDDICVVVAVVSEDAAAGDGGEPIKSKL